MSDDLPHNPAIAVGLLRQISRSPIQHRMAVITRTQNVIYGANDHTAWLTLFAHGYMQVLLDMLFEVEFVGMTIARLNSLRHDDSLYPIIIQYCAWLIGQYYISVMKIWGAQDRDVKQWRKVVAEAKSLALSHSSRFWARVFQIRRLLLDDKTRDCVKQYYNGPPLEELLNEIAETLDLVSTKSAGGLQMPYMLLYLWIHARDDEHQHCALKGLCSTMQLRQTPELLTSFYEEAVRTVADPAQIAGCRIRHLKDPTCINERFIVVAASFNYITPVYAKIRHSLLDTHLDTQVFLYVLAAGRRQLCLGAYEPEMNALIPVVGYINAVMDRPPRGKTEGAIQLPEHCLHMIVPFVAHLLATRVAMGPSVKIATDLNLFAYVRNVLGFCTTSFNSIRQRKTLGASISSHLRVMRQFTLRCHSTTAELLNRNARAFSDAQILQCIRMWQVLGSHLPVCVAGPPGEPSWRFPFGKGCDWKDCLCSIYKPAHPMQVCQGCWRVAYCGPRCQKSAWKEGHKNRCSKHHPSNM